MVKTYVFSNWRNDLKTYDTPIKIKAEARQEADKEALKINKFAELIGIEHGVQND